MGFALIEVLIAFTILFIVLTCLGFEMGAQYSSLGSSKNEQTAQGLLAQALNEVRALPYTVVAKGLSTNDTTVLSTPLIQISGTTWTFIDPTLTARGTGEPIIHYTPVTAEPPAPFYPHKSTQTVNNIAYSLLTFPTKYDWTAGTLHPVLRVTVVVKWRAIGSAGNNGAPTTLIGQTLVFDKTSACATLGSVNSSTSAPCQPDFTASSDAGNGIISIKPTATGRPPINGLSFTSFDLVLPGTSSTETLTQTSSVLGTAEASGVTLAPTSTKDQIARVLSKSTNDPAAGTSDYTKVTLVQTAEPVMLSSSTGSYSLAATPAPGDSGTSTSTTSATTSRPCLNFTGVARTSTPALPCGAGHVSQGAPAMLAGLLGPLGSITLARVTPPTSSHSDRVYTVRYRKGTGSCSASTGCIYSAAQGGLGQVQLAGLPAKVVSDSKAPPGWSGYLAKVTGYDLAATARAKGTPSSFLTGNATVKATGTLIYYTTNAGAYEHRALDTLQPLSIPRITVTDGTYTVTISASLSMGGTSCAHQTPGGTSGKPHIENCTAASPVSGTITYLVTEVGQATPLASFVMTVNLGTVAASSSYEEAT